MEAAGQRTAVDSRPLLLHVVYRFSVGGLENGVVNLINRMPHERWRHAVVSLTEIDPGFAKRIQRTDVELIALHKPPGHGVWLYPQLWRLYRRLQPAVVHTRNLAALEAQVPAWLAGVPLRVHGEHGRDVDDLDGSSKRHQRMRRLYRPFVHQYVALSQDLASYLHQRVGVPARRITQIYNGVDDQRFRPASAGRAAVAGSPFNHDPTLYVAGTVGRMQTVKDQTLLAQAFVLALQRQPALRQRLRLVLVGDGPLRNACQQILTEGDALALSWLPGERSDVSDVMRGLDCFVLPSLAEGISNTILEAMASGLPVIATDVGGNADLLGQGRCGDIVPAGDVGVMADRLLQLAADADKSRTLGANGRLQVEQRFSLQAMVAAYEGVYNKPQRKAAQG